MKHEIATFGAGCFWCTEAVFQALKGVETVLPGYSGGSMENPTYTQVSNGGTGHVEVAQIEFDPSVISYKQLVEVFFTTHNPTTFERQGADVGEQYKSVIFYHSDVQKQAAEAVKQELAEKHVFDSPIVTEIRPAEPFYEAEDYHKNYYANNPNAPYCTAVIDPKVAKLRQKFTHLLKAES